MVAAGGGGGTGPKGRVIFWLESTMGYPRAPLRALLFLLPARFTVSRADEALERTEGGRKERREEGEGEEEEEEVDDSGDSEETAAVSQPPVSARVSNKQNALSLLLLVTEEGK